VVAFQEVFTYWHLCQLARWMPSFATWLTGRRLSGLLGDW
jgi:hypothetical protein